MSAVVEAFSASKDSTFNAEIENEETSKNNRAGGEPSQLLPHGDHVEKDHNASHQDDGDDEDNEREEDEEAGSKSEKELDLGPLFSLKEQLEKDKDDESLMRWKEQLLGNVDISAVGESKEPEVKIVSLAIVCQGRPELILPVPFANKSKGSSLFTLKEGTQYHLKFCFVVSNNIVSGLKYTNTVWKTRIRVDNSKVMLGTFSPQKEPYIYELEEETTPSGLFARGSYSARTKFIDDDGKSYLDVSYYFEIQKNWPLLS